MKTKEIKINYDHIRFAEQFLIDFKNAKKAIKEFDNNNMNYYETPDWLRDRRNSALQALGRWLVKNDLD